MCQLPTARQRVDLLFTFPYKKKRKGLRWLLMDAADERWWGLKWWNARAVASGHTFGDLLTSCIHYKQSNTSPTHSPLPFLVETMLRIKSMQRVDWCKEFYKLTFFPVQYDVTVTMVTFAFNFLFQIILSLTSFTHYIYIAYKYIVFD